MRWNDKGQEYRDKWIFPVIPLRLNEVTRWLEWCHVRQMRFNTAIHSWWEPIKWLDLTDPPD